MCAPINLALQTPPPISAPTCFSLRLTTSPKETRLFVEAAGGGAGHLGWVSPLLILCMSPAWSLPFHESLGPTALSNVPFGCCTSTAVLAGQDAWPRRRVRVGRVQEGLCFHLKHYLYHGSHFPLHLPHIGLRDQPAPWQPAKTLSHFQTSAQQKVSWDRS